MEAMNEERGMILLKAISQGELYYVYPTNFIIILLFRAGAWIEKSCNNQLGLIDEIIGVRKIIKEMHVLWKFISEQVTKVSRQFKV